MKNKEGSQLDYGERIYDTRRGQWSSVDSKAALYPGISAYALNTPINAIDPDGRVVIFINGNHYGDGGKADYWRRDEKVKVGIRSEKDWLGRWKTSDVYQTQEYAFDKNIMKAVGDNKAIYRDGALGGGAPFNSDYNASAKDRREGGYAQGIVDAKTIIAKLQRDESGSITETIKIVSHSMGGAYAKGYTKALLYYAHRNKIEGVKVEFEVDFSPFQPDKQTAIKDRSMGKTYQFSHSKDVVAGNKPMEGAEQVDTSKDPGQGHSIFDYKGQEQKVGEIKRKE